MKFKEHDVLKRSALALLVGLAATSSQAGEAFGYFRAGSGTNSEQGSQACFGLEGVARYRLGNECDLYGELGYRTELAKSGSGAAFNGIVMANVYSPNADGDNSAFRLVQAFVEAKGVDFLHGGNAWVGKRYYNRPDIHILDFKYMQSDGIGGGIDAIPLGPGKFSYGLFLRDLNRSTASATRHHVIYDGLGINPGGTLKLDATLISTDSQQSGLHDGWSFSAEHMQDKVLGGRNTLALQYGVGPGTYIGNTGNLTLDSGVKRLRVFDMVAWQVTPEFGGQFVALWQRDKDATGTQNWYSIGARPVYALTENFKLQFEVGHDRIRPRTGGETQRLTKFTVAPTLASGKAFWSRPELRLFVTYAKWNRAAQLAATPGSTLSTTGAFGSSTSGASAGLQVETWF